SQGAKSSSRAYTPSRARASSSSRRSALGLSWVVPISSRSSGSSAGSGLSPDQESSRSIGLIGPYLFPIPYARRPAMSRLIRPFAGPLSLALVLIVMVSTAVAGGVNFVLVGPAINGVVPTGKATVDQSKLQEGDPGTITLEVKNVNVPDNTRLDIVIAFTHVATVNVVGGQGKVQSTLPLVEFAFGPDELEVKLNGQDIMIGQIQH